MAETTTTITDLPDYIKQPTTKAISGIESYLNSPTENYVYGSKAGENLYTGMSSQQKQAIGNNTALANKDVNAIFGLNDSENLWKKFAADNPALLTGDYSGGSVSPTANVETSRLVDESGQLGKISDYVNPYVQQTLDPQIRAMNEALARDQRSLASSQQMSGAFGDARHGVLEGTMNRDANQSIMDATGRAYASAYDAAMAQRSSDAGRFDNTNQFNANQQLQQLLANLNSYNAGQDRKLTKDTANQRAEQATTQNLATAATGLQGVGKAKYDLYSNVNDALFNSGQAVQTDAEAQRQATEEFQTAIKDKRYNDALKLLGAINGTPYEKSTTQNSTAKSDAGIWGTAGSILSSIFSA